MPNLICSECYSSRSHRDGCPYETSREICHIHDLPIEDCAGCVAHAACVLKTEPLFVTVTDFHDEFVAWVVEEARNDPADAKGICRDIQQNPYLVIRRFRMAEGPPYSNEIATHVLHCCPRCDALDHGEWRYGKKAELNPSYRDTSGPLCLRCAAEEAACSEKGRGA